MSNEKIRFNCPDCGKTISAPGAMAGKRARCPKCEKPVKVPKPAAPPRPAPAQAAASSGGAAQKQSNPLLANRKVLIGVGGGAALLIIIVVVMIVGFGGSSTTPEEAYTAIRQAAIDKDWDAYYDRLDQPSRKTIDDTLGKLVKIMVVFAPDEPDTKQFADMSEKELFVQLVSKQDELQQGLQLPEVESVAVDGDRATVSTKPGKDGKAMQVVMVREGGRWKQSLGDRNPIQLPGPLR